MMNKRRWILIAAVVILLLGTGCSDDDSEKAAVKALHVATTGSDSNDGSAAAPLLTIQTALDIAAAATNDFDTIRIAEGTYTPGNGLLASNTTTLCAGIYASGIGKAIRIEGGWDAAFSTKSGSPTTILDAQYALKHCVVLENTTNLTLDNLILVKGHAMGSAYPDWSGGGAYLVNSSSCTLTNIYIYNSYAYAFGGGLCINGGGNNSIHATCSSNYSFGNSGGGAYLNNSDGNTVISTFISNRSLQGGGLTLKNSDNNVIRSTFLYNYGSSVGGGICFAGGSGNTINSTIIDNYTDGASRGGGIFVGNSSGNTFSGLISGNAKEAVYLYGNCASTRIVDAILTNAAGTNIIHIDDSDSTGVIVSNCLFGGSVGNTTAIVEGAENVTNQIIVYNSFITNTMEYLYRDYLNGYTANFMDFGNNSFSGAAYVQGNVGIE